MNSTQERPRTRMGHFNSSESNGVLPASGDTPSGGVLANCPIIAAVNSPETFPIALSSPCRAIYILTGNPLSLPEMLAQAREHDKLCMVNIDFLDGLSRDRFAVEFLARNGVSGIVSTHYEVLKAAHGLGLITVQRTFGIDSAAVIAARKSLAKFVPDLMEVLPAMAAPKIARRLMMEHPLLGIIGGGLIDTVREIEDLLAAGIRSVSISNPQLWLI